VDNSQQPQVADTVYSHYYKEVAPFWIDINGGGVQTVDRVAMAGKERRRCGTTIWMRLWSVRCVAAADIGDMPLLIWYGPEWRQLWESSGSSVRQRIRLQCSACIFPVFPVSELGHENDLQPTTYRYWQKQLLERGATSIRGPNDRQNPSGKQRVAQSQRMFGRNDEVLGEAFQESVALHRSWRAARALCASTCATGRI